MPEAGKQVAGVGGVVQSALLQQVPLATQVPGLHSFSAAVVRFVSQPSASSPEVEQSPHPPAQPV